MPIGFLKDHCMPISRIFIKSSNGLICLMWANFSTDGSVLMGLTIKGIGSVEQLLDPKLGELRAKDIIAPKSTKDLKLSFHKSGRYKLSGEMGLNNHSVDRVTMVGPPLAEISEPRMMAEILLPANLARTVRSPSQYDICLDILPGPPPPHRCAIFCMSREHYDRLLKEKSKLVDTSEWECTDAFASDCQVWVWTIRKSVTDKVIPPRYLLFFPGIAKWGHPNQ